jgi:hypothetical protein
MIQPLRMLGLECSCSLVLWLLSMPSPVERILTSNPLRFLKFPSLNRLSARCDNTDHD